MSSKIESLGFADGSPETVGCTRYLVDYPRIGRYLRGRYHWSRCRCMRGYSMLRITISIPGKRIAGAVIRM